MRRVNIWNLAVLAAVTLIFPAAAQTVDGFRADPNTAIRTETPMRSMHGSASQTDMPASSRSRISKDLIAKWQSAANSRPGGGGSRWSSILTKAIESANGDNVLKATTARSLDELHAALIGSDISTPGPSGQKAGTIGNGSAAPQALGSYTEDLVYTPLPNGRCRIADSRIINSPLLGMRSLDIENVPNYAAQGGNGTYANGTGSANCGITYLTAAYTVSVTLVSPAGAGNFKVVKYGEAFQTGNTVWMNAGSSGASADLVVRSCQGCVYNIGIYANASVHYVIDVVGYYMPPKATPLACTRVTNTYTNGLANGVSGYFEIPYCPQPSVLTGTFCSGQYNKIYISGNVGSCAMHNASGYQSAIYATAICCNVPGR